MRVVGATPAVTRRARARSGACVGGGVVGAGTPRSDAEAKAKTTRPEAVTARVAEFTAANKALAGVTLAPKLKVDGAAERAIGAHATLTVTVQTFTDPRVPLSAGGVFKGRRRAGDSPRAGLGWGLVKRFGDGAVAAPRHRAPCVNFASPRELR